MSQPHDDPTQVFSAAAGREKRVFLLESSWRQARPSGALPSLEEIARLLEGFDGDRAALLPELVHVDLEHRLRVDPTARVELYLNRFPELRGQSSFVVDLLASEFSLRRRSEPGLSATEYEDRFPELMPELERQIAARSAVRDETTAPMSHASQLHDTDHESTLVPIAGSGSFQQQVVTDLPRRFGDYELLEKIGQGGMGVVFKARQPRLRRMVALKMIRSQELASPDELRRFYREANAAATFDHPGIVPVYEAGEHAGQPYFCMALVEGKSLALEVASGPLPPKLACQWMEKIAEAVHFAHQKGVIHRDLKPANILLQRVEAGSSSPRDGSTLASGGASSPASGGLDAESFLPRITDFGLAKRVEGDDGLTSEGMILGTPSYMSPEQASGQNDKIGPAADIYSLGATLYHLLTGRAPFQSANRRETVRQVLDLEAIPPRRLIPSLPRDLETVCLKCLEKPVARRYASAQELADELGRIRRGEPILARPVSRAERAWRWCRRKPALASLSLALGLTIAVGFLAVAWQWRRAEANGERARVALRRAEANLQLAQNAVEKYYTDVSENKLLNVPKMKPLRTELLGAAVDFFQQLANEQGDDPRVRAERAKALQRLADIKSRSGSDRESLPIYAEARKILEELTRLEPDVKQHVMWLSKTLNSQGSAYSRMGKFTESEDAYLASMKVVEHLLEREPTSVVLQLGLAGTRVNLANLYQRSGKIQQAEVTLKTAIQTMTQLHANQPDLVDFREALAMAQLSLGRLYNRSSRAQDALRQMESARHMLQSLVQLRPEESRYRFSLAATIGELAGLYNADNQLDKALAACRQDLEMAKELMAEDPEDADVLHNLAATFANLGYLASSPEQLELAEGAMLTANAIWRKLSDRYPEQPEHRAALALGLFNLGALWMDTQQFSKAESAFLEAVSLQRPLVAGYPENTLYRVDLAGSYGNLAKLKLLTNAWHDSLEPFAKAIETLEDVLLHEPRHDVALEYLRNSRWKRAEALTFLGRHAEALPDWDRAIELDTGRHGLTGSATLALGLGRANTLVLLGHHAQAARAALALLEPAPAEPGTIYLAGYLHAMCCKAALADQSVSAEERLRLGDVYAAKAVELLHAARQAGYFKDPREVAELRDAPDFDVLRDRQGFKELLAELTGTSGP